MYNNNSNTNLLRLYYAFLGTQNAEKSTAKLCQSIKNSIERNMALAAN